MILNNMDFPTFIEYIKDKEVLCFGAGRMLKRLCLAAYVEPYVKAVFDNDTKKHNKKIEYAGQFFDVRSPLDIDKFEISAEKTVALITPGIVNAGRALYDELEKMEKLSGVECFFLSFIFKEPGSMERLGKALNFRLTDKPLIPKYIHYCWFGGNEIPEEQQRFIEGWKEKCPDFEIVRWDESNYDVKKNRYMKQAYEQGKWAFVPDYARKDIIYEHGGIYLDTDVEIIRNMEDLLYQKGFAGVELDGDWVAFGLGFGGAPGLNIMAELRDVYENEDFIFSKGIKTGPGCETEILQAYGYKKGKGLQTVAEITVYPPEVMSGTLSPSDKPFITENTFSVHHYAGSWLGEKIKQSQQDLKDFYNFVTRHNNI